VAIRIGIASLVRRALADYALSECYI